jgi:hypothetical protein
MDMACTEDRCQNYKPVYREPVAEELVVGQELKEELIAAGNFAENGKLVDQHDTYHQYCEACIRMASLA